MRGILSRLSPCACCLIVLLISGCSTAPPLNSGSLHPYLFTSRDGMLRYRLPAGWFDATADSLAEGHLIWLLRSDYAASITVDEICLDAQARRQLGKANLLQLAQLTMPLVAGGKSAVVQLAPELRAINGREFCSYELVMPASGKKLRTILFDTGVKACAITILYEGTERTGTTQDIAVVQDGFVTSLRW